MKTTKGKTTPPTTASFNEVAYTSDDAVYSPSHYQLMEGIEAIEVIASAMTVEQFKGYCLGNTLKYRLRAGNKGNADSCIKKANFYNALFERNKHLCSDLGLAGMKMTGEQPNE